MSDRGIQTFVYLSIENDSLKKENYYLKNHIRLLEAILDNKTKISETSQQNQDIAIKYIQTDCKPKILGWPIVFGFAGIGFGVWQMVK